MISVRKKTCKQRRKHTYQFMRFLMFNVCCTKWKTTVDKFVAEIYNPVVVVLEHGNVLIIFSSFSVQSPIVLSDRYQAGSSLEAKENIIFSEGCRHDIHYFVRHTSKFNVHFSTHCRKGGEKYKVVCIYSRIYTEFDINNGYI